VGKVKIREIYARAVKQVAEKYGIPEEVIWNEIIPEIIKNKK
jgi:hypothetical protein